MYSLKQKIYLMSLLCLSSLLVACAGEGEGEGYKEVVITPTIISQGISAFSEELSGRKISLYKSEDDLKEDFLDYDNLQIPLNFTKNTYFLVKTAQRHYKNDAKIILNDLISYEYKNTAGIEKNKLVIDLTYIYKVFSETASSLCDFEEEKSAHYVLFSVPKPHAYVIFLESKRVETCQ